MVLYIDDSVFCDKNNDFLSFISSSSFFNKLYVYCDQELPNYSSWIKTRSSSDISMWSNILDSSETDLGRYNLKNKAIVSDIPNSILNREIPVYSIIDASKFITLPISVSLENGRADAGFIKTTLSKVDRELINTLERDERLKFEGKGGVGELKKELSNARLRLSCRNKLFVLCDSDAATPGVNGRDPLEIVRIASESKIAHYCLERRAIENYMPLEYLKSKVPKEYRAESENYRKYEIISKMSEPQRFHFHMKNGFKDQSCASSSLYTDMLLTDKEVINDGFGKSYADDYLDLNALDVISDYLLDENNEEVKRLSNKFINYVRLPV